MCLSVLSSLLSSLLCNYVGPRAIGFHIFVIEVVPLSAVVPMALFFADNIAFERNECANFGKHFPFTVFSGWSVTREERKTASPSMSTSITTSSAALKSSQQQQVGGVSPHPYQVGSSLW